MKNVFKPTRLFISMLLLGCSSCFIACSNDDENIPQLPDAATTEIMFGDYTGKMITNNIAPSKYEDEKEGEEPQTGVSISAKVNNDTVYFEQFPIRDIVLAIVKDETLTDKIVKAVGDVSYKIGYKPTLTQAMDSIKLALDPKPLKLSVAIPSDSEGEEPQVLHIEVQVKAGEGAGYAVESANMQFKFAATEVLLGEGETQIPLPDFTSTTFNFNMNQNKVAHSRF